MNIHEATEIMSSQALEGTLEEAAETLWWMADMTWFAKASIERANRLIDQGDTNRSADRIHDAAGANREALKAHDHLWELVGENLTGEAWEVFCEAETLTTLIRKAEARRRATYQARTNH